MTANQISYAALVETIRHNKATESESERHNTVTEQETYRHNFGDEAIRSEANRISESHYGRQDAINESHYSRMDAETARANLAGESLRSEELELERSKVSLEQDKLAETERHNRAVEDENIRHNKKSESLQKQLNSIQSKNANSTAERNIIERETNQIKREIAQEDARHNKEMERIDATKASAADKQAEAALVTGYAKVSESNSNIELNKKKGEQIDTGIINDTNTTNANVGYTEAKTRETEANTGKIRVQTWREQYETQKAGVDMRYYNTEKALGVVGSAVDVVKDGTQAIKNIVEPIVKGVDTILQLIPWV